MKKTTTIYYTDNYEYTKSWNIKIFLKKKLFLVLRTFSLPKFGLQAQDRSRKFIKKSDKQDDQNIMMS